MARLSAEHGEDSGDATRDPSPDSTELRVSRNTKLESGIPPAREGRTRDKSRNREVEQRLEQTLSDVARTEANLQALVRGLKHLTAGATAALESAGPLVSEIDDIRGLVSRGDEGEASLRGRILELTAELERSKVHSQREHEKFIEQEDLFLVELLTDHERRVQELEQRVDELTTKNASSQIDELIAQRDQAREYAMRCELERDLAWRDLGVQTPAPRVSAKFPQSSDSSQRAAIGSMKFRVTTPAPVARQYATEQTPSPPPAEVAPKPAAVTRRSAEYSLVGGEAPQKPTSTQRLPGR
jgi:hypothetical protein